MAEQDPPDGLQDILGAPGTLMQYSELICFERGRGKAHVDDLVVRLYPAPRGALLIGYKEADAEALPWQVPAGKVFSAYLSDVSVSETLTLHREETTEGELVYTAPADGGPAAMVLLTPIQPGVAFAYNATLETDAERLRAIAARLSRAKS